MFNSVAELTPKTGELTDGRWRGVSILTIPVVKKDRLILVCYQLLIRDHIAVQQEKQIHKICSSSKFLNSDIFCNLSPARARVVVLKFVYKCCNGLVSHINSIKTDIKQITLRRLVAPLFPASSYYLLMLWTSQKAISPGDRLGYIINP